MLTSFPPYELTDSTVQLGLVRGVQGHVEMRMELIVRFGYGRVVPWVRRQDFGIRAIAGPDASPSRQSP